VALGIVETPEPNLGNRMKWRQGTFAARFNRFRSKEAAGAGSVRSRLAYPYPVGGFKSHTFRDVPNR
jgi:hypothetical protein